MRVATFLKSILKKPLRPVRALMLRPVDMRVSVLEAETRQQLQSILAQLSALEALEDRLSTIEAGWRQHLPALLNVASTVGAFGYELSALQRHTDKGIKDIWQAAANANKEIGELWKRVEFVRKEIMYELKYGRKSSQQLPARILSSEKFESARSTGIKINLGCGHLPLQDYLNVDQRELPGVDIVAEAGALPFEQGSLQEIFSAHVLEHFPQQQLQRLLPYWRGLLSPNGSFRAIVPDGEAMLSGIADGSYRFDYFREVLFGAQEYEGDFHFNLLTPDSLTELLKEAGFDEISVPVRGRKNDICFEFEISARNST